MAKQELKQMINRVTIQGTIMDNNIEILVFNLNNPQNIVSAVLGNHNGTLVK